MSTETSSASQNNSPTSESRYGRFAIDELPIMCFNGWTNNNLVVVLNICFLLFSIIYTIPKICFSQLQSIDDKVRPKLHFNYIYSLHSDSK